MNTHDVLSDKQREMLCTQCDAGYNCETHAGVRNVENAVVAALAARSGVDVEALAVSLDEPCAHGIDADGNEWIKADCVVCRADAIRLALAQQEVRHAEREREVERLRSAVNKNPKGK